MNLRFHAAITIGTVLAGAGCGSGRLPSDGTADPVAAIPAAELTGAPKTESPVASPTAVVEPDFVMVEVQGAVVTPGVYRFPPDARLFDALQKAGGPTGSAEIRDLNVAAILLDGSVLSVPNRQEARQPPGPTAAELNPPAYTRSGWTGRGAALAVGASSAATTETRVDLNTAAQQELERLPGVGPKTAEKIIQFRDRQPFTQVDDLRYIQGIGDKRLETLRPFVVVH